jgi:hypothetical protein
MASKKPPARNAANYYGSNIVTRGPVPYVQVGAAQGATTSAKRKKK